MNLETITDVVEAPTGFAELGLSPTSLAALERAKFSSPSPIQAGLVPPALQGQDCLGNAPTGTGKTAAFLLPILERLDERDRRPQALILAPTRELVVQICLEFERLSFGRRAWAVAVVGGESIHQQQRLLARGCQLIVATPGRLIDLMERGSVRLDQVRQVVLDEADQMLDIGFRPAVEEIMAAVPSTRQTLLLSATMSPGVRTLARRFLTDPADVRLIPQNQEVSLPSIRQAYLMVEPRRKFELLSKLLEREQPSRAIIFCRTRHGADELGESLRGAGFRANAIHGNLSQSQRNRVLHAFRSGRLDLLVATDVVGRGIDVRDVSHVVNHDMPETAEHYVHRIGRTGRMGKDGTAFSLVTPDQSMLLDQIERRIDRQLDADQIEGIPAPQRFRPRGPRAHLGISPRRPKAGMRPGNRRPGGHGHGQGLAPRRRHETSVQGR